LSAVTLRAKLSTEASKELVEAAWRRTEANCPVLYIFREPVPVKVEFEIV